MSLSLSENRVLTSNEAKFLRDVLLLRMAIIFSWSKCGSSLCTKDEAVLYHAADGFANAGWIWSVMLLRKRVLLLQ